MEKTTVSLNTNQHISPPLMEKSTVSLNTSQHIPSPLKGESLPRTPIRGLEPALSLSKG